VREPNKPRDLTPEVGSQTDISALGRVTPKPAHERTADEDIDVVDWNALASDPEFRKLLHKKKLFIIPATVFFIVYYFALPISVGFYPEVMARPVIGAVNLAYLFALSQFFAAWILAGLYVVVANRFDKASDELIRNFRLRAKPSSRGGPA
jgi:uncharacterized membrane protein (DUF485 family)